MISKRLPDKFDAFGNEIFPTTNDLFRYKVDMIVHVFKELPKNYQDAILGYLGLEKTGR